MAVLTERRQLALERRVHAVQDALMKLLVRKLRTFFQQQAIRVVDRYLVGMGVKMAENELLGEGERRLLEAVIRPIVTEAWLQAGGLVGELVGGDALAETDARLQELLNEAGARIKGIHEETLRAVRAVLVEGGEKGYSPWQIANGVPKDGFRGLRAVVQETYKGRAETIARTELAIASQTAAHDRYQEAGVEMVDIMDGVGCGWTQHNDPDHANGTRRTLMAARAQPLSHPNCRRVSLPVLERV